MLVLTRKLDESIMIGDDIEIRVVEIKGDQVKIGISAPRDVSIHRREVYAAIQEENLASSRMQAEALERMRRMLEKRGSGGPDAREKG